MSEECIAALVKADALLDSLEMRVGGPALVWSTNDSARLPSVLWTWDLWSLDDCDYIAALPPGFIDSRGLFDEGGPFGCCNVEEHTTPKGRRLLMGHHS